MRHSHPERKENMSTTTQSRTVNVRRIALVGTLSAVSAILMFFSFNVPLMPGFIKMDFSELPALLASFALGPLAGVLVCLFKNIINLAFSSSMGVGELSNFILGASFVFTAGMIYKHKRTAKGALIASVIGSFVMGAVSVVSNYYLIYPMYINVIMQMTEAQILGAYQSKLSSVNSLFGALVIFNLPFTFLKGLASAILIAPIYKRISGFLKKF